MQRLILTFVVGFLSVALWCDQSIAQEETVWLLEQGDWFDAKNWTLGVPNQELSVVIPNGVVGASSTRESIFAANLSIGQIDGLAQLDIQENNLNIIKELDIAHTSGRVTSLLTTTGRQADVIVGGDINVAVAREGLATRNRSSLQAEVNIEGSLLARSGTSPTLRIGSLDDDGFVQADVRVANDISGIRNGFSNVLVGIIGQGAAGRATSKLEARELIGDGKSTLIVGANFGGTGLAQGQVEIHGVLDGFQSIQLGDGGTSGRGIGSLISGDMLNVGNVEVGNKLGTGFGQLEFHPGGTFHGNNINVYSSSHLVLPQLLVGSLTNLGQVSFSDDSRAPSVVKIDGSFSQAENGITSLDVRNFDPDFGYDRLEVTGDVRLGGRLDIRFARDFDSTPGTFDFIQGKTGGVPTPIRLINPPKDLAVAPDFRDGFRISLVEPVPLKFVNSEKEELLLGDPELWNGVIPQSIHQLKLVNNNPFGQTVRAFDSTVQSLTVGGFGGVDLVVPKGETLSVTHNLTIDSGSTFALPGSRLITSELTLKAGAKFQQAGGTVVGNLVNSGRLNVGSEDSRMLSIEGDFIQESLGVIELDLLNGKEFDQIVVDGESNLDGTLLIKLPENLKLEAGIPLPLIQSTDGTLDLDVYFHGIERYDDFNLKLQKSDGNVTLFAISADLSSLGDMNADGVRDETDILAFSMALTDISAYLNSDISDGVHPLFPGDLNFDNQLDLDDIEPFLACVESDICLPEFMEVPEPQSVGFAAYLVIALVVGRRRRIERT